jgi:hypothetical protein
MGRTRAAYMSPLLHVYAPARLRLTPHPKAPTTATKYSFCRILSLYRSGTPGWLVITLLHNTK